MSWSGLYVVAFFKLHKCKCNPVRSNHKWSPDTHRQTYSLVIGSLETHVSVRSEQGWRCYKHVEDYIHFFPASPSSPLHSSCQVISSTSHQSFTGKCQYWLQRLSDVASSWPGTSSSCSISSCRCSVGLRSCELTFYCSQLNSLSCSWDRLWTVSFMWHGVLPRREELLPQQRSHAAAQDAPIGNSTVDPVALNYRFSFIKRPRTCRGEKRPHIAVPQPDVRNDWCMCSCGFFLHTLVFLISLAQQEPGFICISSRLVEGFYSPTAAGFTLKRSRPLYKVMAAGVIIH